MKIASNLAAMHAQRTLETNRAEGAKAMGHLAEGKRIIQSAEDSAGLSISLTMSAKSRSLRQASRNTEDGQSVVQVMEGAFSETSNMLIRFRELAIQAASDTISDNERRMINAEVQQLRQEVDRMAHSTSYNDVQLLNGGSKLDVQVGTDAESENQIGIERSQLGASLNHIGLNGIDFAQKENAQNFLARLDSALLKVGSNRATLGAIQNHFNATLNTIGTERENIDAAKSRILDADYARETADLTRQRLLEHAGIAVLSQANQSPNMALKLLS